jgi:hypothetical protein
MYPDEGNIGVLLQVGEHTPEYAVLHCLMCPLLTVDGYNQPELPHILLYYQRYLGPLEVSE